MQNDDTKKPVVEEKTTEAVVADIVQNSQEQPQDKPEEIQTPVEETVKPEGKVNEEKPDYMIILPWNFQEEIMRQEEQEFTTWEEISARN